MEVKIRKATLDDIKTISNIYALSWKSAYKGYVPQEYLDELKNTFWVSSFKNWINNNALTAQLICEDEIPVGCIAYGKARDDNFANWGEIKSFYLLPDSFRKGYGKRLLQTAIFDMNTNGYKSFYLWVLKENYKARNFYESNGFICSNEECTCEILQKQLVEVRYILTETIKMSR